MRDPLTPLRLGAVVSTAKAHPWAPGVSGAIGLAGRGTRVRQVVPEGVAVTCLVHALALGGLEIEPAAVRLLLAALGERLDGPALWRAARRDGRLRVVERLSATPDLVVSEPAGRAERRWHVEAASWPRAPSLVPWLLLPRSLIVPADVRCACNPAVPRCRCQRPHDNGQSPSCACFAGLNLLHAALAAWFQATPTSVVVDRHLNWNLAGGGGAEDAGRGLAGATRLCSIAARALSSRSPAATRELSFLLITSPQAEEQRRRLLAVQRAGTSGPARTSGRPTERHAAQHPGGHPGQRATHPPAPAHRAACLAQKVEQSLPGWERAAWSLDGRPGLRVSLLVPREVDVADAQPHDRWLLSGSGTRALHAGASFDRADFNRRPAADHFVLTLHDTAHSPHGSLRALLEIARSSRPVPVGRFVAPALGVRSPPQPPPERRKSARSRSASASIGRTNT